LLSWALLTGLFFLLFAISGVIGVFINFGIQKRDFSEGHVNFFEENSSRFFNDDDLIEKLDNIYDIESASRNLEIDDEYRSFAIFEWHDGWDPIVITSPALSLIDFTPKDIEDFYRYHGTRFWHDNRSSVLTKTPYLFSAAWRQGRLFLLAVEIEHSWLYEHLLSPRRPMSLAMIGVIPRSLLFALLCVLAFNFYSKTYSQRITENIKLGLYDAATAIPVLPGLRKLVDFAIGGALEVDRQKREKRVALMEKLDEIERERRDFALVNEISIAAAAAPDLRSSTEVALERIVRRLGVRCGAIFANDATDHMFLIGEHELTADVAHALAKSEGVSSPKLFIQEVDKNYAILPIKSLPGIEDSPIRSLIDEGLTHCIMIPLHYREKVWGAMHLYCPGRPRISDRDKTLLTTVANTLTFILENKKLLGNLDERIKENINYYELSKMLISTSEFDILLENILWVIREFVNVDRCSIMIADEEGETLTVKAVWGYQDGHKNPKLAFGEGIPGWVAQNGQEAVVRDVSLDTRCKPGTEGVRSELAVPLLADGKVIGVISCESCIDYAFKEADMRFLLQLAGPASLAIKRTMEQAELAKHIILDRTTGVYNREYFEDYITKHGKELLFRHGRISMAVIGIANLREIVSEYGKLAGELIIKQTGDMLVELFPEAVMSRYSESEFYVLLPGLGDEAMEMLIDTIRNRSIKWSREHADARPLSFTAGYAIATRFDELESLIARTNRTNTE